MRKKIYLNNLKRYMAFFMIPMIVVGVILTGIVSVRTYRGMIDAAGTRSRQVESSFGIILNNVILESDQFVNNPSIGTALRRLTSDNSQFSYRDYISMRTINASMLSIMSTYDAIEAISFYSKDHPYYYSSSSGRTALSDQLREGLKLQYDQLIQGTRSFTYTRPSASNRQITAAHLLALNNDMILLTLQTVHLARWVGDQIGEEEPLAYFYSVDGEFLFGCSDKISPESLENEFADTEVENVWVCIGGESYYRTVSYQEAYDLYVVYLTPRSAFLQTIEAQLIPCFIVILTGSLAAIFLSFYSTRRETNRLTAMIELFSDAGKGIYPATPRRTKSVGYDLLMDNLLYMFLHEVEMREERDNIEKSLLQLQINPHFLFNALQNLSFQIRRGESAEKEIEEITALSEILRYALSNPDGEAPLHEEILYLKKYVMIQEMRFNSNLIVYYEIDEDLPDSLWVHRLILQPLVENSIVHGMAQLDRRCYVYVTIQREGDQILFQVEDNGRGMTEETLRKLREQMRQKESWRHIGISNVNRRLLLHYGEAAELSIQSAPEKGTTVSFRIPEQKLRREGMSKDEEIIQ